MYVGDTYVADACMYVCMQILLTIPFSSKRKRMSVVIRDPVDGLVKIITKGDVVLYVCMYVHNYAQKTLLSVCVLLVFILFINFVCQ